MTTEYSAILGLLVGAIQRDLRKSCGLFSVALALACSLPLVFCMLGWTLLCKVFLLLLVTASLLLLRYGMMLYRGVEQNCPPFANAFLLYWALFRRNQETTNLQQRCLDNVERDFYAKHELGGHMIVTNVVTLEPPMVSQAELQSAGIALQRHHPLLRSAVVRRDCEGNVPGQDLFFDVRGGNDVEVRDYGSDMDVKRAATEELDTRLPAKCCFRLGLCGPHVLITYHHGFLDGISLMIMLEDLLRLLDGLEPSSDKLGGLLPAPRDNFPWYKPWVVLSRRLLSSDNARALQIPKHGDASPRRMRRQRQIWKHLSPAASQDLLGRCHLEGTTLQACLAAAMCQSLTSAMARLGCSGAIPGEDRPPKLEFSTMVNVRAACGRGPKTMGNYYGTVPSFIADDRPFWDLARNYKKDLQARLDAEEHLRGILGPPYPYHNIMDWYRGLQPEDDDAGCGHAISISNRGAFQFPRAVRLHWCRQHAGDFDQAVVILNACSVNGILCFTICYVYPLCSEELAELVADVFMEVLSNAASEQQE